MRFIFDCSSDMINKWNLLVDSCTFISNYTRDGKDAIFIDVNNMFLNSVRITSDMKVYYNWESVKNSYDYSNFKCFNEKIQIGNNKIPLKDLLFQYLLEILF